MTAHLRNFTTFLRWSLVVISNYLKFNLTLFCPKPVDHNQFDNFFGNGKPCWTGVMELAKLRIFFFNKLFLIKLNRPEGYFQ